MEGAGMALDANAVSIDGELDPAQAERMLTFYGKTLDRLGYVPVAYEEIDERMSGNIYGAKYDALNHAMWMCDETRRFVRENRWAKVYRWIGMIQGLLFMGGVFSIAELKQHNRIGPQEVSRLK
jgi:hypothetical protein